MNAPRNAPTSAKQPGRSAPVWKRARRAAFVAGVAAASLALAACAPPVSQDPSPSPSASQGAKQTAPAPALESFYSQDVSWSACEGSYECATVKAPLDYAAPEKDTVSLALIRVKATGKRLGSLLMNPGGPGGSGVSFVSQGGTQSWGSRVRASYDLIGFDPRGVGRSTAVKCFTAEQTDQARETARLPLTPSDIEAGIKESKTLADACLANSPTGLLQHVDTVSSARDMDLLRAVLQDDKLNYLGFSYGTKLGATYAELFPAKVGRMVLDGALDPALESDAVGTGQAVAFERALDLYLQTCLTDSSCPFTGDVAEARKQLTDFVASAEEQPLSTDSERSVPGSEIVAAILLPLYEPAFAPQLTQALVDGVEHQDGTALLGLADLSAERAPDGSYSSNTQEAFVAINCLDYTHGAGTVADVQARAKALSAKAPFFGPYMGFDDNCSQWPAKTVDPPHTLKVADTVAPIVVIGTTGDPATPYQWAGQLVKQLPGSALVTYKGEGHTAYGRSNECIQSAVDDYLVDGSVPASDPQC